MDAIVDRLEKAPGSFLEGGQELRRDAGESGNSGNRRAGFCGDLQQAVNRAAEVRDELAPLACCALAARGHAAAPPSSVMN